MLIDKKFIFLSLPRCASTSFMITCLKNDILIEHFDSNNDNQLHRIDNWQKMNNEELADSLTHLHEPLNNLQSKFGNEYRVISVRRNKYERFLSLWKHIIDELHRENKIEIANIFSKLTIDDIFGKISPNDISTQENRELTINNFLDVFKCPKEEWYIKNMMMILFTPILELTIDNSKILWFDINHLDELEKWVSKKLDKEFKLEKINSSQHIECNIEINDEFIQKYDSLFRVFDQRKLDKTLI
jgi:hypothetical protein